MLGDLQVSDDDGRKRIQTKPDSDPSKKLFVSNRSEERAASRLKKIRLGQGLVEVLLLAFSLFYAYTVAGRIAID